MAEVIKDYSKIVKNVEKPLGEREEIVNRRNKVVCPRKYHMTDSQIQKGMARWAEITANVSKDILSKCSSTFFNPYRENGGYYGGVQALFLLGANEWHSFPKVRKKMQEDMKTRKSPTNTKDSWVNFAGKGAREGATVSKDLMGRIIDNFRTLQRLGGVHPYGYKLKQLQASVDVRREADGMWYFRLNTSWKSIDEVAPIYDISAFTNDVKDEPEGKAVEEQVIVSSVTEEVAV